MCAVSKANKQSTNDFDRVLSDLGRNSDDEGGVQFSDDEEEEGGEEGGESGEETDEARDAADAREIAQLEEEQEDIVLTPKEARGAKIALEKVRDALEPYDLIRTRMPVIRVQIVPA